MTSKEDTMETKPEQQVEEVKETSNGSPKTTPEKNDAFDEASLKYMVSILLHQFVNFAIS